MSAADRYHVALSLADLELLADALSFAHAVTGECRGCQHRSLELLDEWNGLAGADKDNAAAHAENLARRLVAVLAEHAGRT